MTRFGQQVLWLLIGLVGLLAPQSIAAASPPGGGSTPPADPAIVFRGFASNKYNLSVMNADGARKATVLTASGGSFFFPCWSPDGRSVCFGIGATVSGVTYWGVAALDIAVVNGNAVGSNFRMLVATPGAYAYPAWSPDGTRIAYNRFGPGAGICIIPATGGAPALLYSGPVDGPVAWSPDSTRLAFASDASAAATINVLDVATGSTFQVCSITGPNGFSAGQLDWGRTSGNRITFHATPYSAPGSFMYTVEAAAGAMPQLVTSSAWFPTWSPDDSRIAYTTGTNDSIVVRNLQTGAVTTTGGRGRMANWRRY